MPISKRINNLSISNAGFAEHETFHTPNSTNASNYPMAISNYDNQSNHHQSSSLGSHSNHSHTAISHGIHTNHLTQSHANLHMNGSQHDHLGKSTVPTTISLTPTQEQMHHLQENDAHHNGNNERMDCYSPDLSVNDNPHYYNKNKLLFDLHIERQRRNRMF